MNRTAQSLNDLISAGLLTEATPALKAVAEKYAVAITPTIASLIDRTDPSDPIAKQFIPSEKELTILPGEVSDPISDEPHSPVKGIVHRYPDRVLLVPLHTCAAYCRFCFRRERLGQGNGTLSDTELRAAFDYIRDRKEIWEVILSGGDPFVLSDRRISEIVLELNKIDHVKIIRFHTRIPVVDPARITPELVKAIKGCATVYVLIHCNHARELTPDARAACAILADAGIPLLSQSVLLRGINDTVESLSDLMRAFVESRIKPHYIHQGDLAPGTSHFRVPIAEGQELLRRLRGNLSGLCQPTYILDTPGGHGKVPLGHTFAIKNGDAWEVEDFHGDSHAYEEA